MLEQFQAKIVGFSLNWRQYKDKKSKLKQNREVLARKKTKTRLAENRVKKRAGLESAFGATLIC